jgi:hypothetical protein
VPCHSSKNGHIMWCAAPLPTEPTPPGNIDVWHGLARRGWFGSLGVSFRAMPCKPRVKARSQHFVFAEVGDGASLSDGDHARFGCVCVCVLAVLRGACTCRGCWGYALGWRWRLEDRWVEGEGCIGCLVTPFGLGLG